MYYVLLWSNKLLGVGFGLDLVWTQKVSKGESGSTKEKVLLGFPRIGIIEEALYTNLFMNGPFL